MSCNRFREIPLVIPIYFNRPHGSQFQVDITRGIRFKQITDPIQSKTIWNIHAIICYSNSGGGNYYTIFSLDNNQWYMFSNDKIPSLIKIIMSDQDISDKIKQECVMAIYRLD